MRRSIFKAGVWTALGLAIAFAVVSANSSRRPAATTAAKAPVATVASSHDECPSSDACPCDTKVTKAAVAATPKKAVKKVAPAPTKMVGAAGMVVVIDPESGELTTPTADQVNELRSQVVVPSEPVQEIRFPNGAIGSTAAGEADYATVHVDANGKKVFGHGTPTSPVQPAKPALEEK